MTETATPSGAWVLMNAKDLYLSRDKHGALLWQPKPDAVLGDPEAGTGDTATTLTWDSRDEAVEFAAISEDAIVQQWRRAEQLP